MLLLMGLRIYYGFSFSEPLQYISSGDEQASLYAIWKYVNGLEVFTDPTRSPYSMSYFNALFYAAYGTWTWTWQGLLSVPDAWIPTIARTLTLVGVLLGWVGLSVAFRFIVRANGSPRDAAIEPMAVLSAAIVFVGPLMGFWAITVRPDVWALTCEAVGVLVFLKTYGRNKTQAAILAAIIFFIAWMFKQSAIGAVSGVGLFLLTGRCFRPLVFYCAVFWGLCAVCILGGDDVYRQSLFFSKIQLVFSPAHALGVWGNALPKTLPIYLPLLLVIYGLIRHAEFRARLFADWVALLFLTGFVASAGVMSVLTLQDGSAENYTFTPTVFAAGLLIRSSVCAGGMSALSKISHAWIAAAGIHVVLCILVIAGAAGLLDAAGKNHAYWTNMKTCIDKFPKPVFVQDTYLSLPWMVESTEPFVLAHTYSQTREVGVPHEMGGIGGRIAAGEFRTLALSTDQADVGYDGARLDGYKLQTGQCGNLFIWSRVEP
ncbi:MAG: hypothetical protein JJ855_07490 [Rhodospirillales bacterium]|nr:hypothetical protein [Rhodospirillales bacterium]